MVKHAKVMQEYININESLKDDKYVIEYILAKGNPHKLIHHGILCHIPPILNRVVVQMHEIIAQPKVHER